MPDIKIKELLKKYLEGRATPEEEQLVDDWYASLSGGSDDGQAYLLDSEKKRLRNLYWNSLQVKINQGRAKTKNLWPFATGVAAAVTLILLGSVYMTPSLLPEAEIIKAQPPVSLKEIDNNSQTTHQVNLADGSKVVLFPGSKLQYSGDFNQEERKVILTGQAFFEIAHNEAKPFYVFANEVVTKVLGTSFSIKAYPGDVSITVAVKTGKVSVYTHEGKNRLSNEEKIILSPNQQAVYTRSSKKVSRMLVEDPVIIIPDEEVKKIRFEGAPVSEIFEALKKMYGVDIVFEEAVFSRCFITTSVTGDDLYDRINVICEITGATYTIDDTRIMISGNGCN